MKDTVGMRKGISDNPLILVRRLNDDVRGGRRLGRNRIYWKRNLHVPVRLSTKTKKYLSGAVGEARANGKPFFLFKFDERDVET